jgi:voltage-gated potassium channel
MLKIYLIGIGIVAITVVLHALGTIAWVRHLSRQYPEGRGLGQMSSAIHALLTTVVVASVLHALQVAIWAIAYLMMLPAGELQTMEEALYFSFVTFTTLGYGDITLSEGWRILSGMEALNGILLVGWTTALLFAVVQRTWQAMFAKQTTN